MILVAQDIHSLQRPESEKISVQINKNKHNILPDAPVVLPNKVVASSDSSPRRTTDSLQLGCPR